MIKRIVFDLILFASVFLGQWWLTTILSTLLIVIFKNYWEAVAAAVFMDALYYMPSDILRGNFGIFTLSFVLIVVIAEKIKKQIRI